MRQQDLYICVVSALCIRLVDCTEIEIVSASDPMNDNLARSSWMSCGCFAVLLHGVSLHGDDAWRVLLRSQPLLCPFNNSE